MEWSNFVPATYPLRPRTQVLRNCQYLRFRYRGELDRIPREWDPPIPGRTDLEIHCHDYHAVSGAAVVNSKQIWSKLLKHGDKRIFAIDMEAYAVLVAGRHAGRDRVKVMIAKSVCDYGVNKKDEAQPYAAYTSVRFFRLYAETFLFDEG